MSQSSQSSQCSRVAIKRAVEGVGSRFEVCAILHRVAESQPGKTYYDALIADESGAVAIRIFPESRHSINTKRDELVKMVGRAYVCSVKVCEYEKTKERTGILFTIDDKFEDDDERGLELEDWYRRVYASPTPIIHFLSSAATTLCRIDIAGIVAERLYDMKSRDCVKITYSIKSKDVVHYCTRWNEEHALPDRQHILLRNVKRDYYRNSLQLTIDELTDVIHLQNGTVVDVSTTRSPSPKKMKQSLDEDDLSIINLIKPTIEKDPTSSSKFLMIVLEKMNSIEADKWLPSVMSIITECFKDDRNKEIILQHVRGMIKEIPVVSTAASVIFPRIFMEAARSLNKKTQNVIQTELLLFLAAMKSKNITEDEEKTAPPIDEASIHLAGEGTGVMQH